MSIIPPALPELMEDQSSCTSAQRSMPPFFVHGMFPSRIQPPAHSTAPTTINPTANTHTPAPRVQQSPSGATRAVSRLRGRSALSKRTVVRPLSSADRLQVSFVSFHCRVTSPPETGRRSDRVHQTLDGRSACARATAPIVHEKDPTSRLLKLN